MWLDIGIVLLYLAVLVGMGLRGGLQVKSAGDFTASGGRYGTLVLFASLSASFIGGGYSSGNAAAHLKRMRTPLAFLASASP